MADLRGVLERAAAGYKPPEDQLERTLARVKRRERRKRIRAATLALFVAAAGLAGTIVVFRLGRATTPVAPPSSMAARVTDTIAVGRATSIAYGADSLWVSINPANSSQRSILRIDPQSDQILATIPVPFVPGWDIGGGGLSVAQGSVWVAGADRSGGAILRVDPSTNAVADTIPLKEGRVADVAVDASAIWALISGNQGAPEVVRIDPSSDRVVATIRLNGGYGRSIFAIGGSVFVAITQPPGGPFDSGTLVRIDQTTNQVVGTFDLGTYPSVAVGNGMMWAVTANGGLVQIDPATGQPTRGSATVPCTGDALAVGAGGVWCFGPARERALTRFNPETGEVDVAMRPDQGTGGTALATSPGSVWVVNGEQITRIDLAPSPPVTDSSNAIVAMASGRGIPALDGAEIVRIDPVSGGVTQLTHAGDEGRSAMSPGWSPDGERIAFVMGDMHQPAALAGTYDIYVMGADASGIQRATQGINAQLPTWSPDGERIAFVRDQGAAISVVDLATGSVKDVFVPRAHQIVQVPSWSPDGSRIAFQMGPETVDIYTVDFSTGDLTRLTDDGDSGYPAWSPDGSRIAFRRGDNIWVMSADGTGATRITTCTLPCVDSFSPVWSPDGSTLAFVRQGDGGASLQLFEVGIDGSDLHRLTSGQAQYSNPSWRPGSHR